MAYRNALDDWLFHALNTEGGSVVDFLGVLLSTKAFGISFGIVLALLFAMPSIRRGGIRLVMALGIAVALSDGVGSQVLRRMFDRTRPCYALAPDTLRWIAPAADVGSLPSLHAANFFAMATIAAAADARLGASAFVVAAAVALSRVYVGVHWPTDVLAGAAWGVACALAALALATRVTSWRPLRCSPRRRGGEEPSARPLSPDGVEERER